MKCRARGCRLAVDDGAGIPGTIAVENFLRFAANLVRRGKGPIEIDLALQRELVADAPARFTNVDAPIGTPCAPALGEPGPGRHPARGRSAAPTAAGARIVNQCICLLVATNAPRSRFKQDERSSSVVRELVPVVAGLFTDSRTQMPDCRRLMKAHILWLAALDSCGVRNNNGQGRSLVDFCSGSRVVDHRRNFLLSC